MQAMKFCALLLMIMSIVVCVIVCLANIIAFVFGLDDFDNHDENFYDFMGHLFSMVLYLFSILFAVLLIGAELSWSLVFKMLSFVQHFFGRGMFLIYLGVLTFVALVSLRADGGDEWRYVIVVIAGWLCVTIGIIYTVVGCICNDTWRSARGQR